MSAGDLAITIDELYRRAVEDPLDVDDPFLAEWAETASEMAGQDRQQMRAVRRAIRVARKLVRYWTQHESGGLPDWRNGVDEALGGLGWQAQLDLVRAALELEPDPELFAMVKDRHRSVHFSEWMEGVSYEEWRVGR